MRAEELAKTFPLHILEAALEIKEAQENGSRTTEENL